MVFLPKQTQKQIFTELGKFNTSHLATRFLHLMPRISGLGLINTMSHLVSTVAQEVLGQKRMSSQHGIIRREATSWKKKYLLLGGRTEFRQRKPH